MPKTKAPTGMDKAVAAAGGQAELARLLGVKRQAVQQWVTRGWAPEERWSEIEGHTGVRDVELMKPSLRSRLAGGFEE